MTDRRWFFPLTLLIAILGCCRAHPSRPTQASTKGETGVPAAAPRRPPPPAVVVEPLAIEGDLPVFALQGGNSEGIVGVVLHGHCSHGLGLLQAFQLAAAKAGRFVALQGDRPSPYEGSWRVTGASRNELAGFGVFDLRVSARGRQALVTIPGGRVVARISGATLALEQGTRTWSVALEPVGLHRVRLSSVRGFVTLERVE